MQHNKTNNALERYNRSINDKFTIPHPSLSGFVITLEEEARKEVTRSGDIIHGKRREPNYKDLTLDKYPRLLHRL